MENVAGCARRWNCRLWDWIVLRHTGKSNAISLSIFGVEFCFVLRSFRVVNSCWIWSISMGYRSLCSFWQLRNWQPFAGFMVCFGVNQFPKWFDTWFFSLQVLTDCAEMLSSWLAEHRVVIGAHVGAFWHQPWWFSSFCTRLFHTNHWLTKINSIHQPHTVIFHSVSDRNILLALRWTLDEN